MDAGFEPFLKQWKLVPDGSEIVTDYSHLLPVLRNGEPAMLKLTVDASEQVGAKLMLWWGGEGAASILDHSPEAVVMERANGNLSLTTLVDEGRDDEATTLICSTVIRLHRQGREPPPDLVPLRKWFQDLLEAPADGIMAASIEAARLLLTNPREIVPLHGDIHHGNILDFGDRGWLAIDPKGLIGERGFDYANLFFNPNHPIATRPGRLETQLSVVIAQAGMERSRLLHWILAWAGLSAIWSINDGHHHHVEPTLEVAAIAEALIHCC